MRTEKMEWTKTFIPFVWEQVWHAYLSTAPDVNFMTGLNYKVSFRKPCDHDWVKTEIHGDQRLSYDARYLAVCSKCRRRRKYLSTEFDA